MTRPRHARSLALAATAAGAAYAVGRLTAALRHPGTDSFEELLVALAAWGLLAAAVWAALIAAAVLAETLSAGRVRATSWVATPPVVRRALVTSLGLALAGGFPGPVSADVRRHALPATPRPPALVLPVPQRLVPSAGHTVLVRPGDSLWALASARLSPHVADARVERAVARWYALNRAVIGADPDLIRPGQRLTAPQGASR